MKSHVTTQHVRAACEGSSPGTHLCSVWAPFPVPVPHPTLLYPGARGYFTLAFCMPVIIIHPIQFVFSPFTACLAFNPHKTATVCKKYSLICTPHAPFLAQPPACYPHPAEEPGTHPELGLHLGCQPASEHAHNGAEQRASPPFSLAESQGTGGSSGSPACLPAPPPFSPLRNLGWCRGHKGRTTVIVIEYSLPSRHPLASPRGQAAGFPAG